MKTFAFIAAIWTSIWFTPDQQGQRDFNRGEFEAAAQSFVDPMWQGVAWYRAGEFERAAQIFARLDSAEANFNQGNAWLMRGQYETAITSYGRALEKRPDWRAAQENRELAVARAEMVERQGGEMGDQKIGADEIVFDKKKNSGRQDTEIAGEQAGSDATVQAMWLRRVQTKPADFLKAKFAYQNAMQAEATE
jgi:Ca-activated chloride channel family protein